MRDVMEQLRAAQPMPRGERLATYCEVRGHVRVRTLWWNVHIARLGGTLDAETIRRRAAPLALARERRRRERAEKRADEYRGAMHKAWADEQATSARFHERGREIEALNVELERLRAEVERLCADYMECESQLWAARGEARRILRAEVARLQPPTREEVERAVDDAIQSAVEWYEAMDSVTAEAPEETAAAKAARDALVKLATRERT